MDAIFKSRGRFALTLILLLVLCAAGGYGLARLSERVLDGGTAAVSDADKLVGTWTQTDSGTEIAFSSGGQFSILGSAAAAYTVDEENKTITFVYTADYGGETLQSTYDISGKTLTLTNKTSNQSQTYEKQTDNADDAS